MRSAGTRYCLKYKLDGSEDNYHYFFLLQVLVDLSDEEGGEDEGGSKPKKEEPEDLGIPNVAVRIPLEWTNGS